ncbi:MAG: NAD(P)H-dependent oxidoreductase [Candidatus Magasanikbacteria bacterium]
MKKLNISLILGTARQGRNSEHVAQYIFELLKERKNIDFEFVDVRNYIFFPRTIPPWEHDDAAKPWREVVKKADAFIIVTPEYNHGYPGELKMLLDQELKAYKDKPVLVVGVSNGGFGGVRMIEHLIPSLRYMGFRVLPNDVQVSKVEDFVKMNNMERDALLKERLTKLVDEIISILNHTS